VARPVAIRRRYNNEAIARPRSLNTTGSARSARVVLAATRSFAGEVAGRRQLPGAFAGRQDRRRFRLRPVEAQDTRTKKPVDMAVAL
jgi:hypothetical protein